MLSGTPLIPVEPIAAHSFSTVDDLKKLVEKQNLPIGVLTPEAWHKFERLIKPLSGARVSSLHKRGIA